MKVTVYSKDDCSLCTKALELINRLAVEYRFELEVIDISNSKQAWEKYRYFVPVVFIDGDEMLHGRIEEESIRKIFDRANKSPS